MLLLKIVHKLKEHKIPYAIVGGHAVAFHGAIRGTLDIDLITKLNLKTLQKIESALGELGLTSRLPIGAIDLYKFRLEYIKNKNLVAWNFINLRDSSEQIDIIITLDLLDVKTKTIKIGSESIKIIAKDDLIKMKKISGRTQDLADIEALKKL